MTVKKCTKERDACENLFLFIDPFAFLTFSLPSLISVVLEMNQLPHVRYCFSFFSQKRTAL